MQRSIDFRTHAVGFVLAFGVALYLFNAPQAEDNKAAALRAAIKEVDNATAKQLVDAGAAVIDVRGREAYATNHIAGARSIPLSDLPAAIPKDLDKAKPIVIYCGDGVTTGPEATHIMNAAGFQGAVNLQHGLEGWRRDGLPTAAGNG